MLEARAKGKTSDAISQLIGLKQKTANVKLTMSFKVNAILLGRCHFQKFEGFLVIFIVDIQNTCFWFGVLPF
jgi:hypothetical protein